MSWVCFRPFNNLSKQAKMSSKSGQELLNSHLMPLVFQGSAGSSPRSHLNSRCTSHRQPSPLHREMRPPAPAAPQTLAGGHLNPHPWSLQLREDARMMIPVSAGLRGPDVHRCGAVMGMMEVTLSGEPQLLGCHPTVPVLIQCMKKVVLNQPQISPV